MMRVVSLLSSTTEIVCALGQEAALVGRSHECDFPASVLSIPVSTEARIDASQPSSAIDAQVKASLRSALSLYEVKGDVLARLRPDVLLTQDLCDVCAVSRKDVEETVRRLVGFTPRIVSTNPQSL